MKRGSLDAGVLGVLQCIYNRDGTHFGRDDGQQRMSPTLLRKGPYRIYMYSYDCQEPRHVHVDREDKSAKFWLDPVVTLAANYGYSRAELRRIERLLAVG